MNLVVRDIDDVAVVDLEGKLTRGDGDELLHSTMEKLVNGGRSRVIINLEKVPYMDSAGMAELISSHQRAMQSGGAVRLLNPLKRVYDVLHVVKLDTIFEIHQDESKAVASLR